MTVDADTVGAVFFLSIAFLGIIGMFSWMIFAMAWDGPFWLNDVELDKRHDKLRLLWRRMIGDHRYIIARQDEAIALLDKHIMALDTELDRLRYARTPNAGAHLRRETEMAHDARPLHGVRCKRWLDRDLQWME